jgi:hypothetical protein
MSDTSQYAVIPSNPADKKKILDCFQEVANAKTRMDGERSYIKESFNMLYEEFKIPKKTLNKLQKIWMADNAKDVQAETDEIIVAFESLTGKAIEE